MLFVPLLISHFPLLTFNEQKESSPNFVSNIKRISGSQILFPLKSTDTRRFLDDFRENRSQLICLNSLNIGSEL